MLDQLPELVIQSTPNKEDGVPGTPTSSGSAFREAPLPDPRTPAKIGEKISEMRVIMHRIQKRHYDNGVDIQSVNRELRLLEALRRQHAYRVECEDRRRELDEVSILMDEEIDIL